MHAFFFTLPLIVAAKVIIVDPLDLVPSLDAASRLAQPGDIIQMRARPYDMIQTLRNVSGTSGKPVIVEPYPGEHVIVDGRWQKLNWGQAVVNIDYCTHVEVRGLEVANSGSFGLNVREGRYVTVRNNYVHHTYYKAIGGTGTGVKFINNTVHDAVLQNNGTHPDGGWSQCMSSDVRDNKQLNTDFVFEGNSVFNCWGEGIDVILADGVVVRNNVVHDTFSVNIYTDNSRNVWIDSNVVGSTQPNYYRNGRGATAFLIGTENWPEQNGITPIPTVNVTIVNNLAYGGGGISDYREGHYYSNISVIYNTFWLIEGSVFYMPDQKQTPGVVVGNQLKNNVFYLGQQNGSLPWIDSDVKSWDISSNAWVGVSTVPFNFDSTSGRQSIALPNRDRNALFEDGPGCATPSASLPDPSCFKLSTNSALRRSATPIMNVSHDFFGLSRDASRPSISFSEN